MRTPVRLTPARRLSRRLRQIVAASEAGPRALDSRVMRGGIAIGAAVAVLLTGSAAIAGGTGLMWDGSFAHGSGAWSGVQANAGGFTVVAAPGGRAGMAARFVVNPGDRPIGISGERAEVWRTTGEQAGVESFWKWSVYFAPGRTSSPNTWWNTFTQWHHSGSMGASPFSFDIANDKGREWLHVRTAGGDPNGPVEREWKIAPLVRGRWYDLALHVRWAGDASGTLQVWLNGRQVIPETRTPTLYSGQSVYLKQGFYRADSSGTSENYIAGTQRVGSLSGLGLGAAVAAAAKSAGAKASAPVAKTKKHAAKPAGQLRIVQSIKAGSMLKGQVRWAVTPSSPVKQVVFALDGNRLNFTDGAAPFVHVLDTTKLANGTHELGLTVTMLDGTVVWRPYQIGRVTVDNRKP
jgi:hypothetical protein